MYERTMPVSSTKGTTTSSPSNGDNITLVCGHLVPDKLDHEIHIADYEDTMTCLEDDHLFPVSDDDDIVLCYYDVVLRNRDLRTVNPKEWLNDNCIEFYYEYLEREVVQSEEILLLRPAMVHLLAHAQDSVLIQDALPPHLNRRAAVFLPVNDHTRCDTPGGTHWSLLVYIRGTNTFYYYDTINNYNLVAARNIAEKMSKLLYTGLQPPRFNIMKAPQQDNSSDCGIFVISMTELLCKLLMPRKHDAETAPEAQFPLRLLSKEQSTSQPDGRSEAPSHSEEVRQYLASSLHISDRDVPTAQQTRMRFYMLVSQLRRRYLQQKQQPSPSSQL